MPLLMTRDLEIFMENPQVFLFHRVCPLDTTQASAVCQVWKTALGSSTHDLGANSAMLS